MKIQYIISIAKRRKKPEFGLKMEIKYTVFMAGSVATPQLRKSRIGQSAMILAESRITCINVMQYNLQHYNIMLT